MRLAKKNTLPEAEHSSLKEETNSSGNNNGGSNSNGNSNDNGNDTLTNNLSTTTFKNRYQQSKENTIVSEAGIDLKIVNYNDKSFLVVGDVIKHGSDLNLLKGIFNSFKQGYFFSHKRRKSVEHYIKTGEVLVYELSDQEKFEYANQKQNKIVPKKQSSQPMFTSFQLKSIIQEIKSVFESDECYEGASIHDVLDQVYQKYCPNVKKII